MACTHCAGAHESSEIAGTIERLRYFPRQLLTADDMRAEQEYFREKLRRHNRMLHGWGVVCGLEVVLAGQAVQVSPGYALGPHGDEIYVEDQVSVDLTYCTRPGSEVCVPQGATVQEQPGPLHIKIRFAECPSRPMRTLPAGCGCDESACEYSRLRDGFDIRCFHAPQEQPAPSFTPNPLTPACRIPPADPWLVLARLTRTGSAYQVSYTERRVVPNTPSLAVR